MTYKPGDPNTEIGNAKPFWEEVPDAPPPKYTPPEQELQKPFWDEKPGPPRKPVAFAALLFILIAIGAASLWL
jgi:hypothetical protein